jgi:septin family protein
MVVVPLQVDVEFMRELSHLVPVVPVLAKADTMTSEELKVGASIQA